MAIDLGPDGLTLGSTTINDWDDVGGGGFVPIYSVDSAPGTGVVDVDDIFSSTYNKYYITFYVRPATTNTRLYLRLIAGGTVYSTNNYRQALGGAESSNTASNDTQSRLIWDYGEWELTPAGGAVANNTGPGGVEGHFNFCARNESGEAKKIIGQSGMIRDNNDVACISQFYGVYDTNETISYTGLRFLFNSGNIAEFRLDVYGMAGA